MQIRYLEAMQAMAKSANSKVIFLPGANQTMGNALNAAMAANPTGESSGAQAEGGSYQDFGGQDPGFQQAMHARVVENI